MARTDADATYTGYDEARAHAAVSGLQPTGLVAVVGPDAPEFLHGMLTNDVTHLLAGSGCYSALLTPQGRMICDMHVLRRTDDVLLVVEPQVAASLAERLDRSIFAENVRVEDRSAAVRSVTFHGPEAAAAAAHAIGAEAADIEVLEPLQHATRVVDGADAIVVAGRWLGVPGVRVLGPAAVLQAVLDHAVTAGVAVLTPAAFEALRIEAGLPEFGRDMTEETIPLEAGIESRAISMTKGCYVGQEVIVRILHRGHGRVARRLMGIVGGGEALADGASLFADGAEVGHVTSAAYSPASQGRVALAYVKRDLAEPGHELHVGAADGPRARVAALPLAHHLG